jgi:molybdopterin-containing oxidoreductase family membrane subunit
MTTDVPHRSDERPHDADPVLAPGQTYAKVSDDFVRLTLREAGWGVIVGFGAGFLLMMVLLMALTYLFATGIGIYGNNIPVAWAFPIVAFVWWIGIGHAGTFISAFLLLMRQDWRSSINRFAEAMTLFAVACAGLMPLIHLGRPWVFYWLFPYPDTMGLWPQWRSPLVWDVFAVTTYALVSLMFWFMGAVPDFATLRDRAKTTWVKKVYGVLALGWRGSSKHWKRYQKAYLLVGALAVPLVISVHSIVGLDFAIGVVPGWHGTIFPPYFVAGALYSGFAMVLTLAIPLRHFYGLHDYVTKRHLENCAKLMLLTGLIVSYGYIFDYFFIWYSGSAYEIQMLHDRMFGPYAWQFWVMTACNVGVIQLVWFERVRRSIAALFVISLFVNVGMWLERYIIVLTSLSRDYLPGQWHIFNSTAWDWATFIGTLGLFASLWFLFIRFVPVSVMFELRELVEKQDKGELEYQERLSREEAREEARGD